MPVNCSVCSVVCEGDKTMVTCTGKCAKSFHISCLSRKVQDSIKTRGAKSNWQCEDCKPEKDSSSVGSSKSDTTSITKEFLINTMDAFKNEMFAEFKKYSTEFIEFRQSLDFFSGKIDTSNKLMDEMKKEYAAMKKENEQLRGDNEELRGTVCDLENRVRHLEQYSRQTNIEISGIPQTQDENIDSILMDVAKAVNIDMKKESVVAAHRVPSYNRKRTPAIVVKLGSRQERDAWLAGFKQARPLTANKINPSFNKSEIFISEHLSPANKLLLARTKEAAKARGYKYIWCKDGKIFCRKDNGEKVVKILSEMSFNLL